MAAHTSVSSAYIHPLPLQLTNTRPASYSLLTGIWEDPHITHSPLPCRVTKAAEKTTHLKGGGSRLDRAILTFSNTNPLTRPLNSGKYVTYLLWPPECPASGSTSLEKRPELLADRSDDPRCWLLKGTSGHGTLECTVSPDPG